jgi:lysophospholipase L1-like esterase
VRPRSRSPRHPSTALASPSGRTERTLSGSLTERSGPLAVLLHVHAREGRPDEPSGGWYARVRSGLEASRPSSRGSKLGLDLVDLTRDGNRTQGVLTDLARGPAAAVFVTLTAGGNDLLGGNFPRAILRRLHQIAQRIQPLGARVVLNTVCDPSDGDNDVGRASSVYRGWRRPSSDGA